MTIYFKKISISSIEPPAKRRCIAKDDRFDLFYHIPMISELPDAYQANKVEQLFVTQEDAARYTRTWLDTYKSPWFQINLAKADKKMLQTLNSLVVFAFRETGNLGDVFDLTQLKSLADSVKLIIYWKAGEGVPALLVFDNIAKQQFELTLSWAHPIRRKEMLFNLGQLKTGLENEFNYTTPVPSVFVTPTVRLALGPPNYKNDPDTKKKSQATFGGIFLVRQASTTLRLITSEQFRYEMDD